MNYSRSFIITTLLLTSMHLGADFCCGTASFFSPRSQGTNAAYDCITLHETISKEVPQTIYGILDIHPEYQQGYDMYRIADYFFGDEEFTVAGSKVHNHQESAILADYFGLSPHFESDVAARPFLRNVLLDINGWLCYHRWYIHIDAPICWAKTNMCLDEKINTTTFDTYPADYMDTDQVTPPFYSFSQAMRSGSAFGQVQARTFGNIGGSQCRVGLADFHCAIGYKLVDRYRGHASLGLCLGIPTGNQPTCKKLFEPMAGNGKHVEFGVIFTGNGLFWERNGNQRLDIVVYMALEHLFKNRQLRSFDLNCNGFGSRYILAKEFDATREYTDTIIPAINATTRYCDVSVGFQCDAAILAGYTYKGFRAALGYNAWIRSHEEITCIDPLPINRYALKGIQNIGQATQSTATIYGNPFTDQALVADAHPPVFFNTCDLKPNSASTPLCFTNKLFINLQYAWRNEPNCAYRVHPYVGAGGSIEFEGLNLDEWVPAYKPNLSTWSVWAQTGIMY